MTFTPIFYHCLSPQVGIRLESIIICVYLFQQADSFDTFIQLGSSQHESADSKASVCHMFNALFEDGRSIKGASTPLPRAQTAPNLGEMSGRNGNHKSPGLKLPPLTRKEYCDAFPDQSMVALCPALWLDFVTCKEDTGPLVGKSIMEAVFFVAHLFKRRMDFLRR